MSSLTKEQLQRIEDNKRRALEKKAQRLTGQVTHPTPPLPRNSASGQKPNAVPKAPSCWQSELSTKVSYTPLFQLNTSNSGQKSNNLPDCPPSSSCSSVKSTTRTSYSPLFQLQTGNSGQKTNNSHGNVYRKNATQSSKGVFKNIITGYCRLVSSTRFLVDVGYHQRMIDIFKTIGSSLYDPKEKRWTFQIEDHKKLMSALQTLKEEVSISGLPKMILEVFMKPDSEPSCSDIDLSRIDSALVDCLMPFQRDGVCFGISKRGRCMIADDMGLGKTIQALGIAHYYVDDWPLLIVCPSSVRFLWSEAIQTWLPSIQLHHVTVMTSGKDIIEDDTKVLIISYDLLSRQAETMYSRKNGVVILDESHFLKSKDTARTKAATAVAVRAKRVLLLSGTPALSRPIELFSQLRVIEPKTFKGSASFQQYGLRYCAGKQTPWGWDYNGSSNMEELQLLLERRFMIRRLKADVITQLPAKRRQVVILNPHCISSNSKQMKHFEKELRNTALKGMERRGCLLQYYRTTGTAKLVAIQDYIADQLESNKKFLCFAHHRVVMDGICETVEKKKLSYIRIDGSTASSMRKQLCDKFQLDDDCKVAVLSITAANTGITLTAAHLVVFAELFWNPGILTQAEDRAHRIGQQDSVLIQYLVAQGTADDHIWPLIQSKLDVLNKAGLSKDNFLSSSTKTLMNSDQRDLEEYFSALNDDSDELLLNAMDTADVV